MKGSSRRVGTLISCVIFKCTVENPLRAWMLVGGPQYFLVSFLAENRSHLISPWDVCIDPESHCSIRTHEHTHRGERYDQNYISHLFIYLNRYLQEILIFFKYSFFKNEFYSFDCKAEFSASLLQSTVSHDPSEIIKLLNWIELNCFDLLTHSKPI